MSDIIYTLRTMPSLDEYARAEALPESNDMIPCCSECGLAQFTRRYPIVIEWVVDKYEPGSEVIPDFMEAGAGCEIVSDRMRLALESNVTGVQFGVVEMRQDPKLKRPNRETVRTKRRIWLPYEGPPIWDLIVTGRGTPDYERSNWKLRLSCSTCGRILYHAPDNEPLLWPKKQWDGCDFFLEASRPQWMIFCTEKGADLLSKGKFTKLNVRPHGKFV